MWRSSLSETLPASVQCATAPVCNLDGVRQLLLLHIITIALSLLHSVSLKFVLFSWVEHGRCRGVSRAGCGKISVSRTSAMWIALQKNSPYVRCLNLIHEILLSVKSKTSKPEQPQTRCPTSRQLPSLAAGSNLTASSKPSITSHWWIMDHCPVTRNEAELSGASNPQVLSLTSQYMNMSCLPSPYSSSSGTYAHSRGKTPS